MFYIVLLIVSVSDGFVSAVNERRLHNRKERIWKMYVLWSGVVTAIL